MSMNEKIIELLKRAYPRIVHKGDIFRILSASGYMPDTISRCCRKLAEDKKIERIDGKQAVYSYIPSEIVKETRQAFADSKSKFNNKQAKMF